MRFFIEAYKQYAVFQGRVNRQRYWMFVLFYTIIAIALSVIGILVSTGLLAGLFALASLLPAIAITARRLHDTGKSGWWQLISLIPLIGGIVLIYFLVKQGMHGENQFGLDPLDETGLNDKN